MRVAKPAPTTEEYDDARRRQVKVIPLMPLQELLVARA
jgi:hypothetical protein